jgi:hypothetical protein
MNFLHRLKQSSKGKLLLNPFLLITRLKYRPKKVLRNKFLDDNSFDSVEISINSLHDPDTNPPSTNFNFSNPLIFCLKEGFITTDNRLSDCFITRKRELISEITFSYKKGKKVATEDNIIFQRYFLLPPLKTFSGGVFSLLSGGGASINYYHWLFDTLPRLKILSESPYKNLVTAYLVPNMKESYKIETLEFFNIGQEQIIDSVKYPNIKADHIIAATHPNSLHREAIPKWICQFLRSSFLTELHQSGHRHIFISRKKASKRRIINEDLLFKELEKLNFERIFLEDFSFREKIEIFSTSKVIVSPHGASLANLVFAPSNAKVLEIFPPKTKHNVYKNIAENQNLPYSTYTGVPDTNASDVSDLHADFMVDIDEIVRLLGLKS